MWCEEKPTKRRTHFLHTCVHRKTGTKKFGAADPNSETTAMIELAQRFFVLQKQGWRPRRTIIFCSWDAEEYGLVQDPTIHLRRLMIHGSNPMLLPTFDEQNGGSDYAAFVNMLAFHPPT
uniref:Peptidase M28 domain-containing protein n=1 Tax=Triticum urartu TaxID=4572 RepID=A0A8R7V406_TRIUA